LFRIFFKIQTGDIKPGQRAEFVMTNEESVLTELNADTKSIIEINELERQKKGPVRGLTGLEKVKIKRILDQPSSKTPITAEPFIFPQTEVVRNNVTYDEFKNFMTPGQYIDGNILDAYGALVMQRSMLYPNLLPRCLVLRTNFFEVTDDNYVDSVVRYLADADYVIAPISGPVDISKVKEGDLYSGAHRYHWFTVWFKKVNSEPITFVANYYDSSESHMKSHSTDGQEAIGVFFTKVLTV
jgi:hypothetical protein